MTRGEAVNYLERLFKEEIGMGTMTVMLGRYDLEKIRCAVNALMREERDMIKPQDVAIEVHECVRNKMHGTFGKCCREIAIKHRVRQYDVEVITVGYYPQYMKEWGPYNRRKDNV